MHLLPPLHHQVTNVADILSIWEFLFAETKHSGTSQVTIIWLSQTINIGQGGKKDFLILALSFWLLIFELQLKITTDKRS